MNAVADNAYLPQLNTLRDPLLNRGTAFETADRARLGLEGWLPPRVETIQEQERRVLEVLRSKPSPLERYCYLSTIQNENETLFYRVVIDNLQETLPLIYTPTVGQACLEWSRLYVTPRGLYLTPHHQGQIADILLRLPQRDIGIIVVTDGGRILGLGDLGANGMGIPIGKLALYTACAGVSPARCLPVTLDVGTDTRNVRDDPFYLGRRMPRLTGSAYGAFLDEFIVAAHDAFPNAVIQFEDFNNANAFSLLSRYREQLCCFNDDIQGSGAMALAGLYAAGRRTGRRLTEERILFLGAGEAALGIGSLIVAALQREGLNPEQARSQCLFIDSKGTVVTRRADLPPHKREFAQDLAPQPDLVSTIEVFKPSVLIGACGCGSLFTQPVIAAMARSCPLPVVFALSNPTSKAECSAQQAYAWSGGRLIFAAGSPFEPVTVANTVHAPGQANNSYIFPGVGLGLMVSGAKCVTDAMFLAAAEALADQVTDDDLAVGRIFPLQGKLREVATATAAAVAHVVFAQGLAMRPKPDNLAKTIARAMYEPEYR